MSDNQAGPLTTDYAEGRRDGTYVFERFGAQEADGILEYLQEVNNLPCTASEPASLYTIAFVRSVNEAIGNSLS